MKLSPSAHLDVFTRAALPPDTQWPAFEFTLPELNYPATLNAAEELIDRGVRKFGADKPAILSPEGDHWSYGKLQSFANQFARVLTENHNLVPGNRVLLRMPNSPETVGCWLGILKAGGVVITTMMAAKEQEIDSLLQKVQPHIAVVDHNSLTEVSTVLAKHIDDHHIIISGGEQDPLRSMCATKPTHFTAVRTSADDVALLGATSGTTGAPKVTMHFHRDILANADTFATHTLQLTSEDVSASTAPLAFTFGLGALVVFPLRTGGATVLLEKGGPLQLAQLIQKLGITVLYTAPTGYRALLKAGYADELSHLRLGVSAGEHLPIDTFEAVKSASGISLVNGIGSTEMLHVFISASGNDIRPGTTGRPVPGYRATILDHDGNELGAGQLGRLAVIGPTGCRYMDDPRQSNYVSNGWNITGDLYTVDEDGYFTFHSRSDSMIITAGYNVSATEVENVINTHPDVAECAVIARPDLDKGEIVNAFVVARPGSPTGDTLASSISEHVKRSLAIYKCPRRIDFVDNLPRNPSGKIQHFLIRERFITVPSTTTSDITQGDLS